MSTGKGKFDDEIFTELGVPKPAPRPPTPPPPRSPPTQTRSTGGGAKAVRVIFAILGLVCAVLVCIHVYQTSSSWALVIYAFVWVQWLIGRGFGRILTYPHKFQRFFYYVVPVAVATGVLYLADRWWHTNWLSALLGLLVGFIVGGGVVSVIFPRVASQEFTDSSGTTKAQFGL